MLRFLFVFLVLGLGLSSAHFTRAQTELATQSVTTEASGTFVKKRYNVKGQWKWVAAGEGKHAIRFDDNFKTKSGPDLKVYLSPASVGDATGKTATDGAINIGVLKSSTGEQTYHIPDGVDLTKYKSVLIQCEAYSVLWGGFDIPE